MPALFVVLVGTALVVFGVLGVLNHDTVDRFNRSMKAFGTKQSPDDVEMSALSVLLGRLVGLFVAGYGAWIVTVGLR